jgi:5-methylcytosine-specific restriction endonuclease McrA
LRPWARRYLFEINDNKCSLCGWSDRNIITDKIPLEVDHIDGNYLNNDIKNLRLLCPNCHSLTVTYKNLNKGKGRKCRTVNVK